MAAVDVFHYFFTQSDHFTFMCGVCSCILGILLIIIFKYTASVKKNNITESVVYSTTECSNPDCVRCAAKETLTLAIQDRMKCSMDVLPMNSSKLSGRIVKSFKHHLTVTREESDKIGLYRNVGAEKLQSPSVFYLQHLSPVYHFKDLGDYPEHKEVVSVMKNSFEQVKEEFDSLWSNFLQKVDEEGWQENSLPGDDGGKWFTFHLVNQGRRQASNLRRCPVTSKMIEKVERLMLTNCIFGFATFSVLMPGTHITSHCGATNARVRCHLGLRIPDEGCTLTVNKEDLYWTEGECLLFDDSFHHEAKHSGGVSSAPRSVLMIDFWHPDLSKEERDVLEQTFHSDLLNL